MSGVLASLLNIAVVVFSVSSMLSVGLSNSLSRLLAQLRDAGAIVLALVANFVLVPLLALGVLWLVSLEQPFEIGLLLVATAAGAPFLIKLAEAAQGDLGLSAALLVVLLPVTVLYMPVAVPLLIPGTEVSALAIGVPLLLTMLLPLAVGLFGHSRLPRLAERVTPALRHTSTATLVAVVVITVLANARRIVGIARWDVIVSGLVVIGGAFLIGYALGGRRAERREILGLGTSQRNIAAATVVATQSFDDPRIVVMVVVTSLVAFAMLFPVAWWLRRRRRA